VTLNLHNSLTGTIEAFVPVRPGHAGIYLCGPTVSDYAHIGHARSAVVFDVLVRYLRFAGYSVQYVRNFTDIDDKILERSRLRNADPLQIAEAFIRAYREDMKALNVESPDFEPRVTENIGVILEMIAGLVDSGHAYVRGGDVFYRVRSQEDYGLLCGPAGAGTKTAGFRVALRESKEDDRDFTLWKGTDDNGPSWMSPWGRGRPGWHIECVAMSRSLLGTLFDIHGGGRDLIFPHHENERVLSRSVSGTNLARYWLHHELVTVNGRKLSKSVDISYRISDLCRQYHPEALRLFLLTTHYRRPLDITNRRLSEAASALDRLYSILRRIGHRAEWDRIETMGDSLLFSRFRQAMDQDLNVPQGIALLFASARRVNKLMNETGDIEKFPDDDLGAIGDLVPLCRHVLGILRDTSELYFSRRRDLLMSKS
jgi:cysteinyl-tRNA synthetase